MAVVGYILDVGCGNMAAIKFPNGKKMVIDCNLSEVVADDILDFLEKEGFDEIDVFVNTHRDCDHLKGINLLHERIPIKEIWDNGVSGNTDASDYKDYMKLRRSLDYEIKSPQKIHKKGFGKDIVLRIMNGDYDDVDYDINDTSLVLKIENGEKSILFLGDTSFRPWKEKIIPFYSDAKIKTNLLVASHHGSITFFDDPSDEKEYYTDHIEKINPDMTIISVGDNPYELPDGKAIKLYKRSSKGSNLGNKIFMTEEHGHIKIQLKKDSWTVTKNVS